MADVAETAARLLHELREQAGREKGVSGLKHRVETLQGTCDSMVAILNKV